MCFFLDKITSECNEVYIGSTLGGYIKLTLIKSREDSVILRRVSKEQRIEISQPDFVKSSVTDQPVTELNQDNPRIFIDNLSSSSASDMDEMHFALNESIGYSKNAPAMGMVISRYKQSHTNSIYFKNKPTIEIEI